MLFFVLFLLDTTFALGIAPCVCEPATNMTTQGCAWENLTCVNGGWFPAPLCEQNVPCGIEPDDKRRTRQTRNCVCAPGYGGTDCSLVTPDGGICGTWLVPGAHAHQRYRYDALMVNAAAARKHIECFISYDEAYSLWIREHRMNISVSPAAPDDEADDVGNHSTPTTFNIHLRLWSRQHNYSLGQDPPCAAAMIDLDVYLTQCAASVADDAQTAGAYTCAHFNMTGCGWPQSPYRSVLCPPTLYLALLEAQPPFTLSFRRFSAGVYNVTMRVAGASLVMPLECRVGSCALRFAAEPRAPSTTWLVAVVVAGGALLFVVALVTLVAFGVSSAARSGGALLGNDDADDATHGGGDKRGAAATAFAPLPPPLFGVAFDALDYDAPDGTRILRDVRGGAAPRQLTAVLGASGAGKSTLLRLLAGRAAAAAAAAAAATAAVRYPSTPAGYAATRLTDVVAFVPQDDVLLATASVRETLLDAARLRLPPPASAAARRRRVDALLRALALTHVAETRVGASLRGDGISGGERKRLALACELLRAPRVLIADEPTSGLDSRSARIVLRVLRAAADAGTCVVLSIHQPTTAVFAGFDRALLLTRAGRVLFDGAPSQLPVSIERALEEDSACELVDVVPAAPTTTMTRMTTTTTTATATRVFSLPNVGEFTRFRCLFARSIRHLMREPRLLLTQWLVTLLTALVVGGAFWHASYDLVGLQNRQGVLFFTILYFSLISLTSLPVLVEDRALFRRERAAGAYSTAAYFAATLASDFLPLRVLPPVAYAAICYYMIGLNASVVRFAVFATVTVLVNLVSTSACMAIAAVLPHLAPASLVAALLFVLSLLFGGLLLNNHSRQSALAYVQYASFVRYGYELLMINEFVDQNTHLFYFDPHYNGQTITNVSISGAEWIANVGMDVDGTSRDLLVLFGAAVLFIGIAFAALIKR